jgi:hypothetical protein
LNEAFRAFHAELIDYAGLFPPAKLDLATAISNYTHYRDDPDSWMLGRFIVPAARLRELSESHGGLLASSESPFGFSVLVAAEPLDALVERLHLVAEFEQRHANGARIDMLETVIPPSLLESGYPSSAADFFEQFAQSVAESKLPGARAYFELPLTGDQAATDRLAAESMGRYFASAGRSDFGLKLRCGGMEPAAFPHPRRIAQVIGLCAEKAVPLKFTAGLHHPVHHHSEEFGAMMHGFLNVFGAAVFSLTGGLDDLLLERIISDTEPGNFAFTDEGFVWRDMTATATQIAETRRRLAVGFGSCSFDEPREDLRALGMLH